LEHFRIYLVTGWVFFAENAERRLQGIKNTRLAIEVRNKVSLYSWDLLVEILVTNIMNCYVGPGLACTEQDRYTISKRLRFISSCIREKDNLHILDIGTGYGVYRSALLPHAACYIGIDVNQSGLRQARLNDETAELLLSSAEELCFKDNVFDVALLIEVLEHIPDDTKAKQEAYRVLKPGGITIIRHPTSYSHLKRTVLESGQDSMEREG
jgi:SAM-dependent methyltransferase